MEKPVLILGIESSCDETSAAVSMGDNILANVIAGQKVHEAYGGVVPELASRAHQQNIIPVVDLALRQANVDKKDLSAIAFTNGPGLMGALLVGASFARALALGLDIPLIEVNHMQAHILAHFARLPEEKDRKVPEFPFICLTVSGGHTQLVLAKDHYRMELLGQTLDDAAGEAFDKIAKLLGLPYPGGPFIDKLALEGNPDAFRFPKPNIKDYDFSFSGFKTAVLYFLQKNTSGDPLFVDKHLADICASVQKSIIEILISKLESAADKHGVNQVAIAGGVAANSGLRNELKVKANQKGWNLFIPPFQFCTDNAAMIAITGYYKFLKKEFTGYDSVPFARFEGL